jgi:hypothetical protein
MYTREEILNNYKNKEFPKSLFDEIALNNKNILFYPESKPPESSENKDISKLSQSYVLPWRILQQKNYYHINNNQNKVEFSRAGHHFTPVLPKEPTIDIKTENFKHIYDKYTIPLDVKLIYLKYHNNVSGPFNYEELQNMYKNKKFDSNNEFRTIDIFCFKNSEIFTFQSLKTINDEKWIDLVIDSPLLKYNELFKEKEEEKEGIESKKEEKTIEQEKKIEEVKKEEPKKEGEKKEEEKKEDKKEEKPNDNKPKETEGKWEVVGKKKSKNIKEKLDDASNEIIGLKKEGKKGKKKKKGQFEDTNFELGFQIK